MATTAAYQGPDPARGVVGTTTSSTPNAIALAPFLTPDGQARYYMLRIYVNAQKTNSPISGCAMEIRAAVTMNLTGDITFLLQNTYTVVMDATCINYTCSASAVNQSSGTADSLTVTVQGDTGHNVNWFVWYELLTQTYP